MTASLAAALQTSVNAAVADILPRVDGVFTNKKVTESSTERFFLVDVVLVFFLLYS